jgi:hypothetical protein
MHNSTDSSESEPYPTLGNYGHLQSYDPPEGYGKRIYIMDADLPSGLDLYRYNLTMQALRRMIQGSSTLRVPSIEYHTRQRIKGRIHSSTLPTLQGQRISPLQVAGG